MITDNKNISRERWLFRYWLVGVALVVSIFIVVVYQTNSSKLTSQINTLVSALRGNTAYEEGYWGDAGLFYEKALNTMAEDSKLQYNIANAYYRQGRYREAESLYEQLLNGTDNSIKAAAWNNLGNVYYNEGLFFQSFDAYKNSLLLNENDGHVRQNLLLVNARLLQLFKSKDSEKKKKSDTKDNDPKAKDNKDDNDDGKKIPDDQISSSYKVSDKQMNDLLKLSKEQEKVPNGSKSTKQTKIHLNGPDY